jgi:membrane-bound serine protease (ClpP class)
MGRLIGHPSPMTLSIRGFAVIDRRLIPLWIAVAAMALGIWGQAQVVHGQSSRADVIALETIIHPIAERYLERSLQRAANEGAEVVIVEIDTPGGLLTSTREMVTDLFASPVPVVVYVSPAGSRAASAGTFITAAGHIAAMAPGTNIGAASPISGDGAELPETLKEKIFEDSAAEMRSIAERRGRAVEPLEATVLEAKAYTATEALELGIIDLVVGTIPELLDEIDGMEVMVQGPFGEQMVRLNTAGIDVHFNEPGFFDKVLSFVADPNISFLLISLGGLGLVVELWSPGLIFPGVLGLLMLLLGFYALGNLPGNWAGAALILVAFALVIAEVNVDGFGVLGILGAASFAWGGIVLFGFFGTPDPFFPDIRVSPSVLIPVAFVVSVGAALVAYGSIVNRGKRNHRRRVTTMLVGEAGVATTVLDPDGKVRVHGEIWTARSSMGERIQRNAHVLVTDEEGALLTVQPSQGFEPERMEERLEANEADQGG